MADRFLTAALGCARRAVARPDDPAADACLLDRFVRDRDEAAFAELVARHGPVVWAACRRGAATAADAEDAFQATFLVLARRAGRVRRAAAVGGWLFRVAVRLAARTRTRAGRAVAPARPDPDPAPGPADRAAWQDLVAILDAELAALPDAVRAALVCCYYEGLTQDEAARRLGWKVRTIRARVARGRKLLQTRLARRGVDLGAALAAAAVGLDAPAVVPQVSLTSAAGAAVSPAVSDLVAHGLALTSQSAQLRLAVVALLIVAAGVGYAVVTGPGPAPAAGTGGPHLSAVLPDKVPEPPADPGPAFPVAVYDRAVDGCVYIVRETSGGAIEGTGALIDAENRLVLTTRRVVGDSDVVSVQFPFHNLDGTVETDRKEYARSAAARLTPMGRVIHRDKARDLALVQLDRLGGKAHPLEMAEAGVREKVLHIGSGTGELFPKSVRRILQVDVPAAPEPATGTTEPVLAPAITLAGPTDDFGGPLVDREGRLVGIVAGSATGPAGRAVTLAIGTAEIRAFLADKDKEVPAPPAAPIVKAPDRPADLTPRDLGPPIDPIPGDFEAAAWDLYEKCVSSTVFIVTPLKAGYSTGAGSLIDQDRRLVLTNHHVVAEADTVFCQFPVRQNDGTLMTGKRKYMERIPAGEAQKGNVLYRDKTRDLAIVQLDRLPRDARALPLARQSAGIGASVITIGNPDRVNTSFATTQGKVRAVGVEDVLVGAGSEVLRIKCKMVTVSNPILPGDSGGPLIDRRGHQVGVTVSDAGGARDVHRCIDVTEVRAFLTEKKLQIKELAEKKDEPKQDPKAGNTPPANGDGAGKAPKAVPPRGAGPGGGGAAPSAEDERAANDQMRRAKLFAEGDENREVYLRKLKELIAKYPNTAAARAAQKVLDGAK